MNVLQALKPSSTIICSAGISKIVFLVGGKPPAAFEEYDAARNVWRRLTPVGVQPSFLAVAAVGRRLYAIGGLSETGEHSLPLTAMISTRWHWGSQAFAE